MLWPHIDDRLVPLWIIAQSGKVDSKPHSALKRQLQWRPVRRHAIIHSTSPLEFFAGLIGDGRSDRFRGESNRLDACYIRCVLNLQKDLQEWRAFCPFNGNPSSQPVHGVRPRRIFRPRDEWKRIQGNARKVFIFLWQRSALRTANSRIRIQTGRLLSGSEWRLVGLFFRHRW